MTEANAKELEEFSADADRWFAENVNRDPGFMLPLTFMEVGTDQQFDFLQAWQQKVYEAGYLGAAWPSELVFSDAGALPEQPNTTRENKTTGTNRTNDSFYLFLVYLFDQSFWSICFLDLFVC